MFSSIFNWRSGLSFIAIAIVSGTIFYSNYISKKIAADEKQKVEQWLLAASEINNINNGSTDLAGKILTENSIGIPMITVTESDSILDHYNLDSNKIKKDPDYLRKKLNDFKRTYPPIIWKNPINLNQTNLVYYGESDLLVQVRYFPIVQLLVAALFIFITLIAINSQHKSTQNQVWAGMAKETAHQLGTPITSLEGWMEMLKEDKKNEKIVAEITKDIERLKLISDRFGKIGSTPQLVSTDLVQQINNMVYYIKKRCNESVHFSVKSNEKEIMAKINAPLFDWVIENLLKNALDAIDGNGNIELTLNNERSKITIDVKDSGKGIGKSNFNKVFKPGFTTKKRGWGLGLSLSKRIIEQYHKGSIFVKSSEYGKGTTFRIILNKKTTTSGH